MDRILKAGSLSITQQPNRRKGLAREQEISMESGIKVSWLRWARHKGRGPRFIKRQNGGVLYDWDDFYSWLEEQKVRSTTEATARGLLSPRQPKTA